MQETGVPRTPTDDFVQFWPAGENAKGEYHCSDCGHGVTVVRTLPQCPECGGTTWEEAAWSPFTRSRALL
jgi:ribosomal protein L37AE/L43A